MSKKEEITEMVKAGFPCFYIYTEDEQSVNSTLKEIAKSIGYEVEGWTVETGILEAQ